MIEAIRQLAEALPLEEHYSWEIPDNLPLKIPAECQGTFAQNVYLKENLGQVLANDSDLRIHYWVIREWGGIRRFEVNEHNNGIIREFREQLTQGRLNRATFKVISSLSKLAAFWFPAQYSIYDSRAVYSLNWLLFRHTTDRQLFRQPSGRNVALTQYNTETLFRLSGLNYQERAWDTGYHEYCELLRDLSRRALNQERPYHLEMLLFIAAPSLIIQDIKAYTKVTIQTNAQEAVAPDPRPLDRATKKDLTIREESSSLSDKAYAEVSIEAEGIFRIMLVADGQPEADLDKMRVDGESRGILDGFYSPEREKIILEAKDEANHCGKGTPTYVMTTAFGAKPVQSNIRLYNVPGERAIRRNVYLNRYKRSLLEILPKGERIEKVVLVYYASVSRKPFRNKIFSILKNLSRDPHLRTKYDIHVCMYGHSRAHPNERWRDLCAVFDGLTGGHTEILRDLKNRWTDLGMNEYRFFMWF